MQENRTLGPRHGTYIYIYTHTQMHLQTVLCYVYTNDVIFVHNF